MLTTAASSTGRTHMNQTGRSDEEYEAEAIEIVDRLKDENIPLRIMAGYAGFSWRPSVTSKLMCYLRTQLR